MVAGSSRFEVGGLDAAIERNAWIYYILCFKTFMWYVNTRYLKKLGEKRHEVKCYGSMLGIQMSYKDIYK